jgi:hypothetical protein
MSFVAYEHILHLLWFDLIDRGTNRWFESLPSMKKLYTLRGVFCGLRGGTS